MQSAISLLELNQLVKMTLDTQLEPTYWVVAEIGELKQAGQGHAYLDLVEKQGNTILAKMRANIWSYSYRGISGRFQAATGQSLKSGMKVLAQVTVTFHEIYSISLNIKDIDPNFTLGERAKIRQEVIERLGREGMMDLNKRLLLPVVPQNIAVISSVTAAGYGDFINQLQNNRYGYKVVSKLYQATLQGSEAVATMLNAFNNIFVDHTIARFDAIVIIRGGGAQLDLDCFDDYALALEIAKSHIPVITGIGHERDETIADMVAHTKMKTPTAVAEFILSGFREFEERLHDLLKILNRNCSQQLNWEDRRILDLENRLKSQTKNTLIRESEKLIEKLRQIRISSAGILKLEQIKVDNLNLSLLKTWKSLIESQFRKIDQLEKDIQKSDPKTFFQKGYTRTEFNGIPIHKLNPGQGQEISTYLKDKIIKSTINEIEEYGK
ncbi:exodeoxyribonuclease VII large subunit [Aquiflexum sp.]|uniref:exodeoxyribonuclease VII large subunit n=1 Tax=Aquiflexum sp. TaxID=1872584 RepID=UPI003593FF9B